MDMTVAIKTNSTQLSQLNNISVLLFGSRE